LHIAHTVDNCCYEVMDQGQSIPGVGFGLYFFARIVAQHGGVTMESMKGDGSHVKVTISLNSATEPEQMLQS